MLLYPTLYKELCDNIYILWQYTVYTMIIQIWVALYFSHVPHVHIMYLL